MLLAILLLTSDLFTVEKRVQSYQTCTVKGYKQLTIAKILTAFLIVLCLVAFNILFNIALVSSIVLIRNLDIPYLYKLYQQQYRIAIWNIHHSRNTESTDTYADYCGYGNSGHVIWDLLHFEKPNDINRYNDADCYSTIVCEGFSKCLLSVYHDIDSRLSVILNKCIYKHQTCHSTI